MHGFSMMASQLGSTRKVEDYTALYPLESALERAGPVTAVLFPDTCARTRLHSGNRIYFLLLSLFSKPRIVLGVVATLKGHLLRQ